MILILFSLAALYGVVALVFLVLSSAELIDSGRSSAFRLMLAAFGSLFWPVTVILMTAVVALTKRAESTRRRELADPAAAGQQVS